MERIRYIYKLTAPNGKVYIGQTSSLEKRMSAYARGHCKNQKKLYRSIRKYGWDNFIQEIIFQAECSDACLNRLEIFFIDRYNSYKKGLNMTEGGSGARGVEQSEEHIAKRSAALKGKPKSPETRAKMSTARKGRKLSPEHIAKLSTAKGKGRLGPHSPERVARRSAAKRKPIQQLNKDGIWIKNWNSIKEAGETLGVQRSDISNCLAGRIKSAGGFVWKYVKKS